MVKLLYISVFVRYSNKALQWTAPFISTVLTPRQVIVIELWAEPTYDAFAGEMAVHSLLRRHSLPALPIA